VSCGELERLFLAGGSPEDGRRHRASCAACRSVGADLDSATEMTAPLRPPAWRPSLRAALIDIPRWTVSCEGAERLLPLAVESELEDEDERRLSSHLSRCAGCAEAAATLGMARELVEPAPAPWLATRIAAARPRREKGIWTWLLGPKTAIGLAYAAAVAMMVLGFNPADLARRVRVDRLGETTKVAVTAAESSITDRIGALQEDAVRTFTVWRGRAGAYGRAAVSNAVAFLWKSSATKERPGERTRNPGGRGAFREKETAITTWRA